MSGWDTEAEVVFWLKGCLIGKASEVLYDACDNADVLWSRLESRFGDRLHLQRYQNALPARKRNRNEPLPDLASDIRKMADIVYSGIDFEQKEKLAITHFVNALDSPNACYDITDKKPKSLEEALAIAMNREIYLVKNRPGAQVKAMKPHRMTSIKISGAIMYQMSRGCQHQYIPHRWDHPTHGMGLQPTRGYPSITACRDRVVHSTHRCHLNPCNPVREWRWRHHRRSPRDRGQLPQTPGLALMDQNVSIVEAVTHHMFVNPVDSAEACIMIISVQTEGETLDPFLKPGQ